MVQWLAGRQSGHGMSKEVRGIRACWEYMSDGLERILVVWINSGKHLRLWPSIQSCPGLINEFLFEGSESQKWDGGH